MGVQRQRCARTATSHPHPNLPPSRGKEKKSAAFRRFTVLLAPLRRSPNKPPALCRGSLTLFDLARGRVGRDQASSGFDRYRHDAAIAVPLNIGDGQLELQHRGPGDFRRDEAGGRAIVIAQPDRRSPDLDPGESNHAAGGRPTGASQCDTRPCVNPLTWSGTGKSDLLRGTDRGAAPGEPQNQQDRKESRYAHGACRRKRTLPYPLWDLS